MPQTPASAGVKLNQMYIARLRGPGQVARMSPPRATRPGPLADREQRRKGTSAMRSGRACAIWTTMMHGY